MKQPLWTDDESCLNRCAELAEIARSRGESPVGSLIVVAGRASHLIEKIDQKDRKLL